MIEKKTNSLSVWFFENLLRQAGIGHFVSTRIGGHSVAPFESLNLSLEVGDDPEAVVKNRTLLVESLGISMTGLTMARQVHGAHVQVVSEKLRGRGAVDSRQAINAADAMVTDLPGVCLVVLLADCVPVLFCDTRKNVIGVAHAGWKGTLRFIASATVRSLKENFDCSPHDILVGIGPSAGPCCYEVGPEVVSQVERHFGEMPDCIRNDSANGKQYLDLWQANLKQVLQEGIPEENIETARICTCDNHDLFYSFRAEKGNTGRFGAGIVIFDI